MPIVTFQQGVNGYNGTSDTRLRQAAPTTALGDATSLGTDFGTNAEEQGLLSFSNLFGSRGGPIPDGAVITSATLTLQTTNGSSQGGTLHRMKVGWSESSTWSSLGNGIQIDGSEALAQADLATGAVSTGSRSFDVTSSLQAWSNGAANFGWVFKAGGTDGWDFYSSEGSIKPLLSVTYTTGTTPSTAGVLVTQSGGSTTVTEGAGTDTFTVALSSAPAANVTVSIGGNADIGRSPMQLTFTPTNWQTAQTVTLTAVNDSTVEGTEIFSLPFATSSTDPKYNNLPVNPISVTVIDNDGTTPPAITAAVVKVTQTTTTTYRNVDATGYGSGDPSGLAYIPSLQRLFIADSEHEESPYSSSTNLFAVRTDGSATAGYSLTGFTREPTGLGYNPKNGYLYIGDDDKQEIFWVDPANPSSRKGQFDTAALGFTDTEDLKFDSVTGNMFVLDGRGKRLFELTDQGKLVKTTALPSVMSDAEALAYDPTYKVFFVASGASPNIWEMDRSGNVLATISVLGSGYSNPVTGARPAPKGLELAPSSNTSDGNRMSLYVADYGVDQKNDGRLFEISLGSGWQIA